jgi:hypothetical protein
VNDEAFITTLPTPRGSRICGSQRTCRRAFLDLWQAKELQANFAEVWQAKGLRSEKQDLEDGALTGGTGRGTIPTDICLL